MRSKIILIFCILIIAATKGFAASPVDSIARLKGCEDSMKALQYMRLNAWTDGEREDANAKFLALMNEALLLPGAFDYPFDSLKTIGKVTSPDNQFRIITWDVPKLSGKDSYYGFIQCYNEKKSKYDLFVLKENTAAIPNIQTATYTPDKWMGMLYYKIIQQKDSKTYTLLAWQGYSKQITRKIIDVLSFNNLGVPSFGKVIFTKLPSTYKGSPKRMVFEYSAQAFMSLRYDEAKNMILFDHLGPIEDGLQGQHQYYGPGFQVDGLKYGNGTWDYVANVEARNPDHKDDKLFNDPQHPTYQPNNKAIYTPH